MKSVLFSLAFALIRPRAANRDDLTSLIRVLAQKKHKKCTQTHLHEDNKAVRGQTQTLHNNAALCKVSAGSTCTPSRWRMTGAPDVCR